MKRPGISDSLEEELQEVVSGALALGLELGVFCKNSTHSLTAEPARQSCLSFITRVKSSSPKAS